MIGTVVGLDLSLTCTGIARITTPGPVVTAISIQSTGRRADTLVDRARRIDTLADKIMEGIGDADLVVMEGPSYGSQGGSPVDRHGLWWAVVGALVRSGVPVAVCAPATRAKALAGHGRADKAAVAAAVCRLYPDVELCNSDESDAVALAHLGAVWLSLPVPTLVRHREALVAIQWPVLRVPQVVSLVPLPGDPSLAEVRAALDELA